MHLAVIWAFGVAKPLLDVLANSPEFFVARGNTSADIVLLALVLLLLPPTALLFLEWLVPIASFRRAFHAMFVAVLLGLLALQLLIDLWDGSSEVLMSLALAFGVVGAVLYVRTRLVPTTLTVLGPAPVLFLMLFLVFSPVSDLVFPEEVEVRAADGASNANDPPIVWITFDEFSGASLLNSAGRIDAERYPHFAALAKDSSWYPNATTVDTATTVAVPALMAGTYPEEGQLPIAADYPGSIFALLRERYKLDVTEAVTAVCPEKLCGAGPGEAAADRAEALVEDLSVVSGHLILPKDLRERLPAVDRGFGDFADAGGDAPTPGSGPPDEVKEVAASSQIRRGQLFDRFVKRIGSRAGQPTLHFLHSMLPHVPWRFTPSGQWYTVNGPEIPALSEERWADDRYLTDQGMQRYLLQVGLVERLIGRLTRRLRATGLYDRSIVVITADHGVAFEPGLARRDPHSDNIGQVASVPLIIKLPGRKGRVDYGAARTIDIVPTIADELGVEPLAEFDGRSLAEINAPERATFTLGTGRALFGFDDFLRTRDEFVARKGELFGEGNDDLLSFHEDSWLVGTRLDDLGSSGTRAFLGPASDEAFQLDTPGLYNAIDPDGPVLPTFVTGRVGGEANQRFALAVNGRIRATGRTYSALGEIRAGAMIPAEALRSGPNRVELFFLDDVGTGTRLVRARSSAGGSAAPTSVAEVRSNAIVLPSGERVPLRPAAVTGYVDSATVFGNSLTVFGWAIDTARRKSVKMVLVFADGKLIAQGRPTVWRDDLSKRYGKGAVRAGFQLSGPTRGRPLKDPDQLRVFGVSGGRASELGLSKNARFG